MNRREYLQATGALIAAIAGGMPLAALAQAPAADESGSAVQSFSWDELVARMKQRAAEPYEPPSATLPKPLADLDYDRRRLINYRRERSVWRGQDRGFQMQAFHPGGIYDAPVQLFEVADGAARPITFSAADFEYLAPLDPAEFEALEFPGVAGIRLLYPLNRSDHHDEVVSFLGASYFRALGRGNRYGLSARGLAVDTAAGAPEEFPVFTRLYIERPEIDARQIRVWAELESARVSGAYAFTIAPGTETIIDVSMAIFLRGDVSRLGIAPLTSMYLFGENDRTGFDDFRPEVHDSDGLAILRANGERVWRPLVNPGQLQLSLFSEVDPGGFGLLQRDRAGDAYLDTEARYERRPSVWIEPVGNWGKGAVWLAEIPSSAEIHDNIVAFWMPREGLTAGSEHHLQYRMIWALNVEEDHPLGRVTSTRTGHGGVSGVEPDPQARKFVITFAGGSLPEIGPDDQVTAGIGVDNGTLLHSDLQKLEGSDDWRLVLDVKRGGESRPVELRADLHLEGQSLTETWTYQWGTLL
ncbi:glucan biosynthesis protein [Breoghania sp. L-A4]|uniref:glucan biosynthesis protein n=1 Tax=Breoghania sp. L-A4 TaxID=2304600 RepID=UPI000E35B4BD|nr:glucan biosynthesis protein [Breoghania sp. L-A4]AXS40292.1 glucans biosynthesis protein [Breoghania sp. L-A4]